MTDQQEWKPAITFNDKLCYTAGREERFGYITILRNMKVGGTFTNLLWHYPADSEFKAPKEYTDYLQCAGTAQRMTVEVRHTNPDGTYTHDVLAREPITGDETETIAWDAFSTQVHPEEVWTAQQAAPIFDHYSKHRDIPEWVQKRPLDI